MIFKLKKRGGPASRSRYLLILLVLLGLFSLAGTVRADSVDIEPLTRECVVGESLFFNIRITLDQDQPIDVSAVKYEGEPLRYEVRNEGTSSFTVIVNGKTLQQSTGLVKNFIFEIPTDRVGPLTLPPATIKVGDRSYPIKALQFEVVPKPTSDDLLFETEIINRQATYYPTQVIELACRLYYRGFSGSPAIDDISLPILRHRSFKLLPDEEADREVPVNGQRFAVKQRQGVERLGAKQYQLFAFNLKFRLMEPGTFEFDNFIKMRVETGRIYQQRSFFGYEAVKEKKTLYAQSRALQIEVRDLPPDNVPPSFNGAIGSFNIKVTPSSDTAVKVGDPITLAIEISGRGTWEFVKSPPLYKLAAITDYFKVSGEPVTGEVAADGSRKTFLMRLRVNSKTVKEIPPIPFTFFDLTKLAYVTIYSAPVPISVYDSPAVVQVVDFRQQAAEAAVEPKPPLPAAATQPTGNDHGENIAARLPELIPIAGNVDGPALHEDHAAHYYRLYYALAPLLAVLLLFVIDLGKNREISPAKLARTRAANAYKTFLKKLADLEKSGLNQTVFFRELGSGIDNFLEERFSMTAGEPDRPIIEQLRQAGKIDGSLAETLARISEKIDEGRYSAADFDHQAAGRLLKEVKEVLRKC